MTPVRLLHILPQVGPLGATRGVITTANELARDGAFSHVIASLTPAAPAFRSFIAARGLPFIDAREEIKAAISEADIVHARYWNSPAFFEFWSTQLDPMRLLLTSNVSGRNAPQYAPDDVLALAYTTIASSGVSAQELALRAPRPVRLIHAAADFSRFNELPAIRKGRGTIGAMMALEEAKAHREIYTLLARAARDAQAILGGEGAMLAEIAASARAEDNVKIAGHISDIEQFFKDIDLFAHPLAPHSYATSEASVHEAMYAGRPPILLAGRGPVDLIAPGLTGIVAQDENAFVEAARHLAQDGETRAKMGRAARDFATETLGPGPIAAQHRALYLEALERPRTAVAPLKARSGAQALLHAFGPEADDLLSLMGQLTRAERPVSALPLRWIAPSSGGILHYRRHYPDDRELRTWAALSFEKMGRPAMAAMERRAL